MVIYESTKCSPYVYICTHKETGQFYIGSRCRNVYLERPSHIDFPLYKTSSKEVKPNFSKFDWIVLAEFFNSGDAYDFEQELINEHWGNPLLINKVNHFGCKARWIRIDPPKWSDESRKKLSNRTKGCKKPRRTKEHQEKLNASLKGRNPPPLTNTSHEKMRKAALHRPLKTCPHCGTESIGNTIFRWHFDNCKLAT